MSPSYHVARPVTTRHSVTLTRAVIAGPHEPGGAGLPANGIPPLVYAVATPSLRKGEPSIRSLLQA